MHEWRQPGLGVWLTNDSPRSFRSAFLAVEGWPKATRDMTVDELINQGMVGVYSAGPDISSVLGKEWGID